MLTSVSPLSFRLRDVREAAGLTQQELAERVGVRQATISDLERGQSRRIDFDLLDALCGALSDAMGRTVVPGELLEREPEPKRGRRAGA